MTLTPECIADMREALDTDPDLDSVTSRRTEFLALLDIAERFSRLRDILESLRALEAAATDAPWEKANCGGPPYALIPSIVHRETLEIDGKQCKDWVAVAWFGDAAGDVESNEPEHDRELIAAARNALPALLREIQETP